MDGEHTRAVSLSLVSIFLRVGLAVVFLYTAAASFIEPDAWIGYMPAFLRRVIPANLFLTGFSIIQILLSFWLLSGKKLFYSSLLSAAMLIGIIVSNLGALDIVFRDFAILFSALALAALEYAHRK
jgi:hypothetical protein